MDVLQTPIMPGGLMGRWDYVSDADWADVLADFPLFTDVAKRRLRKLAARATFAEYGRGDTVITKGAPGDSLYVILGGSARARGKASARTLRVGDYFGELGVLDGVPRSATVDAIDELHVMKVPRQTFLELAQHEPAVSFRMVSTLGGQIRRLETQAA
jgi:CRP-like cAMP-binding protein